MTTTTVQSSTETAWRIHASLADWTGKVDAKAAFALSIESAVLAGTAALSRDGGPLHDVSGAAPTGLLWAGTALLALSVLLSVAAVAPRLKGGPPHPGGSAGFVYFGHLRHWDPARLEESIRTGDALPALSRQLVVMSQVAWRKHRLVQASLAAATAGACLLAVTGLTG